jgi:hypothetical protein
VFYHSFKRTPLVTAGIRPNNNNKVVFVQRLGHISTLLLDEQQRGMKYLMLQQFLLLERLEREVP